MVFIYLRIHAISIDLYSKSEKNVLIKTLTAELSDIQYQFKFMALSRPVDISPLITEMSEMLKEAEDKRKELLRQEILQMGGFCLVWRDCGKTVFISHCGRSRRRGLSVTC